MGFDGDDYWANMEQARKDLASLEPLCEKHGVKANMQIHFRLPCTRQCGYKK